MTEQAPVTPGLRERNKTDKLQRILAAARQLFVEQGFDETTTREIARRAGVGLGTLFLYARAKRDLLFLVCTEELETLTDSAFSNVPRKPALIDELVAIFGHYYRYFAAEPTLARAILRELTFFAAGEQGRRLQDNRQRVFSFLGRHISRAKADGLIDTDLDSLTVGWVVFAVYQAQLRQWLQSSSPNPAAGLRDLRAALDVVISGLGPRAVAP